MTKLWIKRKLYLVDDEVSDYIIKLEIRIAELEKDLELKSRWVDRQNMRRQQDQ